MLKCLPFSFVEKNDVFLMYKCWDLEGKYYICELVLL